LALCLTATESLEGLPMLDEGMRMCIVSIGTGVGKPVKAAAMLTGVIFMCAVNL